MSLRSTLQNNPIYVALGACVVLLIAAFLVLFNSADAQTRGLPSRWAYDLNTGKILVAASDQLPPFDTGSGTFDYPGMGTAGAGVYANIYVCGVSDSIRSGMTADEVTETGARFLTLARFSDEALNSIHLPVDEESNQPRVDLTQSLRVSDLSGAAWYPEGARQALELHQAAIERCESGEYPVPAMP